MCVNVTQRVSVTFVPLGLRDAFLRAGFPMYSIMLYIYVYIYIEIPHYCDEFQLVLCARSWVQDLSLYSYPWRIQIPVGFPYQTARPPPPPPSDSVSLSLLDCMFVMSDRVFCVL